MTSNAPDNPAHPSPPSGPRLWQSLLDEAVFAGLPLTTNSAYLALKHALASGLGTTAAGAELLRTGDGHEVVPNIDEDIEWLAAYCRDPRDPDALHLPRLRRLLASLQSERPWMVRIAQYAENLELGGVDASAVRGLLLALSAECARST